MVLRRTSRLKLEVSLDEPLNTDWDGNELLLSDILARSPISFPANWTRPWKNRCWPQRWKR